MSKILKEGPLTGTLLGSGTEARVCSIQCREAESVVATIANSGANALNAFRIAGRASQNSPYSTLQSGDFTTPSAVVYFASGDPASLGPATNVLLKIEASDLESIELYATSSGGTYVTVSTGIYAFLD